MAPLGEIEHFRWRLTASTTGYTVCAIPEISVYEGTGFHLGNSGLDKKGQCHQWGVRWTHPLIHQSSTKGS